MEINANPSTHRIALITGGISLSGSSTFLVNLTGELVRRGQPAEVFSFEQANPLATDFQSLQVPVLCLDERRMIFEDRLEAVLRRAALNENPIFDLVFGLI